MDIKEILKEKGISLSKFAEDFGLSRNTTLLYFNKYNNNEKLPKEKYQIVFDQLFSEEKRDEFDLNYISLKYLVERDKLNGTFDLSPDKTDFIMRIIKSFVAADEQDAIDKYVLYFVNTIISSSTREIIFKTLAKYFYFFNNANVEEYEKLSEEDKIVYTNYFKLFTLQKQNLLVLDSEVEKLFISRMTEINKLKEISEKK